MPGRVFWQVGSSATLGTGTVFVGNILAMASVTATAGVSLEGRALARTGAVTIEDMSGAITSGEVVVVPVCGDSVIDANETCDDGNVLPGDGCSELCLIEIDPLPVCGDNVIDIGEACDDGNVLPGDGYNKMRISFNTLKLLIDCGDISAYMAYTYSIYESMKNAELWSWDNGVFFLRVPTGNKWFQCSQSDEMPS